MHERTDSGCRRAPTRAGKQTGISSNTTETTWIKSSVSLSLSDQNSQSTAVRNSFQQHAGAGMSDTIRSGTNWPSGRVGSQKNKSRQTLVSIQKNNKLLSGFHWLFPQKELPCKWEKWVFSETGSTYTWFRNSSWCCATQETQLAWKLQVESSIVSIRLFMCKWDRVLQSIFFFSFLLYGQKIWQLAAWWDCSDSSLCIYHKDRLSHWIHKIMTEPRAGWKYSTS